MNSAAFLMHLVFCFINLSIWTNFALFDKLKAYAIIGRRSSLALACPNPPRTLSRL